MPTSTTLSSPTARGADGRWLLTDAALVLGFAALGRASHEEALDVAGLARTAAPFLAGAALGWGLLRLQRRAGGTLGGGVTVWLAAVIVGMALRRLSEQGTATSFVVVTFVVLGALLLGPRAAVAARRRRG